MSAFSNNLSKSGTPSIRADLVDIYIFRIADEQSPMTSAEFLQLRRSEGATQMPDTWQPVMGHIDPAHDRSAIDAAVRETREEVGLRISSEAVGFWQIEQVYPFFVAGTNQILLTPRFAVRVRCDWSPRLNPEHIDFRWVPSREVGRRFVWPGQAMSIQELLQSIVDPSSPASEYLRIASPNE